MSSVVTEQPTENIYLNSFCFGFRFNNLDGICPAFYKHYFRCDAFRKAVRRTANGTTRFNVSKKEFAKLEIPIPPLEIQQRIVDILDKFSALAAELQAELHLRRKQYEYYRTQLLTPHSESNSADNTDDCNWVTKTLGDVCDIKNGKDYKHLNDGKYPVYGSGGIMTYKDQYVYDKPSILLPRKGSIGKIHYVDVPFWNVDTAFYTVIDENQVLPKYLFYYLSTINLEAYNTGTGAIPSLTQTVLKTIEVSFPPLTEQARIVSILDKFEALTTSLSDGIPAEQAAQQKRYEYYRDKLLTFPMAEK
jgi:type I restriction enzyme S subunit